MIKILLVEDDLIYSRIIKNYLEKNNFSVDALTKIEEAKAYLNSHPPALVITDFRLPDGTGLEILRYSKEILENLPVLLITNYSDIRVAVKAMKMGAFEYILKPINPDELLLTVNEALEGTNETPKKKKKSSQKTNEEYIVGKSATSKHIEEHIQLVAPTDLTVILLGETGTGKEYIAKRIHQKSSRSHGPFVAIDCGALSKELAGSELFGHVKGSFTGAFDNKKGHLEAAEGGTIFLDEVGNLGYDIQIKLLRAFQERKIRKIGGNQEIHIDIRIIAATNEELLKQAKEGTFREDLYHRLNEFTITALPLRKRKEDMIIFANQFLEQSNQKLGKTIKGFDTETIGVFENYSWPGNLRELKNIVRRAVLLCNSESIGINNLPGEVMEEPNATNLEEIPSVESADLKTRKMFQEKEMIIRILKEAKYNKSKAAKTLGIDRKTLYNKMEKYGID